MKPFFTDADFESIDRPLCKDCAGPVALDEKASSIANAKVQPVLEENASLKSRIAELEAANETNGIIYVKPDVFCVDTIEHEHLRERLAAAEEVAKWYSMLGQKMDEGLVLWDGGEKARAYFASHGEHGDKP